jgi:hypothetical protein
MSKSELRAIARIVLIGLGVYFVLQTLLTILHSVAMMPFLAYSKTQIPIMIILLAIYIVITLAVIYFLFRGANRFSDKIVKQENIDDTQISGVAFAFRLVCVITGVLFLYWTIPNLIVTVSAYISNMSDESVQRRIYTGMSSKTDIAKYVILLGLGIYLAYGAPHFVRWQVKKTIKQCNKTIEQQPA